mmetsp:Transcript_104470/g.207520  ORF Transcript_104470/g.207520 Transcript_104470/m.207520 type:complete len:203 (-) Transcript_104470:12-620(-)
MFEASAGADPVAPVPWMRKRMHCSSKSSGLVFEGNGDREVFVEAGVKRILSGPESKLGHLDSTSRDRTLEKDEDPVVSCSRFVSGMHISPGEANCDGGSCGGGVGGGDANVSCSPGSWTAKCPVPTGCGGHEATALNDSSSCCSGTVEGSGRMAAVAAVVSVVVAPATHQRRQLPLLALRILSSAALCATRDTILAGWVQGP